VSRLVADDVGFVEVDRPELGSERNDILNFFPQAKSLISFVVRVNREPIHNPARWWPMLNSNNPASV